MTEQAAVEDLLRELAPQVLATLMRRHRALDVCEDAVQEALIAASTEWKQTGLPANPRGWLLTVATRRLIDELRSDQARRRREEQLVLEAGPELAADDQDQTPSHDDTLALMLMCCHEQLTPPSQIALTLRAIGGLTTAEIAAAFFVPEPTMAQRISRAKQMIRDAGAEFSLPPPEDFDARLAAVLHVLYLIFNEGYTTSAGADIHRVELTREAIRLTRMLRMLRPDDADVAALLALMLLTDARRAARVAHDGELVSLEDQDRTLWNKEWIAEGIELATWALTRKPAGSYQLQAAIAAVYDEAPTPADTDWPQVLALYELLNRVAPNPMATLSRSLALAMVHGPQAALELLATLDNDERISEHHRLYAVRGHLLELAGDQTAAERAFQEAARRTASLPEKRYLEARAKRLTGTAA
jgi:RNA polymerase sigma factor (sigma-70 family)